MRVNFVYVLAGDMPTMSAISSAESPFQMQDDHLPVEWFERLDQPIDPLQRAAGIELGVDIRCFAGQINLIERG